MKGPTLTKIVNLIVAELLEDLSRSGIENADADSLDATIQRDIDSLETAVYESTLEKVNAVLEDERNTTIERWW